MEQGPSEEANRFSASPKFLLILWNPKVHYHTHKHPPPVAILGQTDPLHVFTSHFLKILFNIIFPYMRASSKLSLSLRIPHQNPVYVSPIPHTRYVPRPPYASQYDHTNNIGWAVHIIRILIMQFSPFSCYLVPLRPKYSPQPLFSYTLSLGPPWM